MCSGWSKGWSARWPQSDKPPERWVPRPLLRHRTRPDHDTALYSRGSTPHFLEGPRSVALHRIDHSLERVAGHPVADVVGEQLDDTPRQMGVAPRDVRAQPDARMGVEPMSLRQRFGIAH